MWFILVYQVLHFTIISHTIFVIKTRVRPKIERFKFDIVIVML
jgi:hypothetical protein